MKDWYKEASHESYWTALVRCLLDKRLLYLPDLLNGHPQGETVLMDTRPPLFHKMILIPPTILTAAARMTVLSHHLFHPCHIDALHPLLHLPVAVNPEQNMTLRWLVEA